MTDATPRHHDKDGRQLAYGALLFFTVLVAVVTFVLSFSGLNDYGRRVAGLANLSWLVPLGVDGLTLCAVAATFLCRDTRLRVRLYCWIVFAVAVACSVTGNLSHAAARHLSWQGSIGAAAWPILLALASHLVIVVRRNMETAASDMAGGDSQTRRRWWRQPQTTRQAEPGPAPVVLAATQPTLADRDIAARPADHDPVLTRPAPAAPPRPATRTPKPLRPAAPRDNDLTRQKARDMYRRGNADLGAIASQLGVSKRSVERYTTDLRQAPPSDTDTSDSEERDRAPAMTGAAR